MNDELFKTFEGATREVFGKWTTLNIAVDQEFGGRTSKKKREDLIDAVILMFNEKGASITYEKLAIYLDERLEKMFNIDEDDSVDDVADIILGLFESISEGDMTLVEKIKKHQHTDLSACRGLGEDSESDSDADSEEGNEDGNMEIDDTKKEPEVDEDGFVTIKKGGKF